MVFVANTRNETDHTMWKGMENCARNWCLFVYHFVSGHLGILQDVWYLTIVTNILSLCFDLKCMLPMFFDICYIEWIFTLDSLTFDFDLITCGIKTCTTIEKFHMLLLYLDILMAFGERQFRNANYKIKLRTYLSNFLNKRKAVTLNLPDEHQERYQNCTI